MRENGFYYIKVEQGSTTFKFSTKTKDRELARDLYEAFLKTLLSNKFTGRLSKTGNEVSYTLDTFPAAEKIEIEPVYQEFLSTDSAKGITINTISFKRRVLEVLRKNGITWFSDINQAGVNRLIETLKAKYDANDTIMKYISKFKAFLHYAIKKGFYSREEYDRLDFIRLPGKVRNTTITESDFTRILQTITGKGDFDFAMYLETLYYTCSRPAEISPLRVQNIDFSNLRIRIEQFKLTGKVTDSSKWAYIPEKFAARLKEYIDSNGITDRLFNGHGRNNINFYGCKFKKLKHSLGLPEEYNLYTIRHTAITDTLNATNDLEFAAAQAGHSDVSMTAKHYVNRKPDHYKGLAQKMEEK